MGLKILHVASSMPAWGGIEKHILDIAPIMERHGHAVTIGCQPGSEIERRTLEIGLPVVPLRMPKRQDWKEFPQFVRALRGRYDVVHIHHPIDYIVPAAAARFVRVPVVVMSRHNPNTFRNILVAYACSKLFYDGIIAVSDFVRGMLITDHVSPDRIVVVRNGIDIEPWLRGADTHVREELGIPASAFVVAAAGRLIPGKGLDTLIRAVAAARRRGVDVLCIIAGEGDGRTQLEQLSKELDVQSSVRLLGFRRDVPAIFGAADVVAIPSVSLESFSYTTLEGMASGRPVIGSRIGGIPELITEDVGRLTTPRDPEGIAEAIVELAGDAEKRAIMGRNAVLRAKKFTLDACVDGIEKVYAKLMQNSPHIASEPSGARTV
jgi:glycosyltransferase involved in cell wall biosynthesis